MEDNPVPPGMRLLLDKDPAALDNMYYVDTGEPLGSQIIRGLRFTDTLRKRMGSLHLAFVHQVTAGRTGTDPVVEVIARYRRGTGR